MEVTKIFNDIQNFICPNFNLNPNFNFIHCLKMDPNRLILIFIFIFSSFLFFIFVIGSVKYFFEAYSIHFALKIKKVQVNHFLFALS